MRSQVLREIDGGARLETLAADLGHLLTSWFNRGFLTLQRIDWRSSASVLQKLIEYEAVHQIQGWPDLRRRLEADRRCYAFFHSALPEEPLIFIEVALTRGMSGRVQPLLDPDSPSGRPAIGRQRHLLFHHQLPGRAARSALRQLVDQAGGRGSSEEPAANSNLRHPVAHSGLSQVAGRRASGSGAWKVGPANEAAFDPAVRPVSGE